VDVGSVVSDGCYGFASRFMHWPVELIVGGGKTNASTGRVVRARALQTVIQLMSSRNVFELWQNTYKVHHLEWNHNKAAAVVSAWQKRFTEELNRLMRGEAAQLSPEDEHDFHPPSELNETQSARLGNYKVVTFSTASLDELIEEFSQLSLPKVVVGYLLMVS
jgi:patched 1